MVAGVVLWHLPGAIWALALSAAIGWLVNQCALRRECRLARVNIRYSAIWSERRVLWHFSLPAALCSAIVGPVTWAANTILINQPNGYAEMGMFNAANQWRTVIMFLPAVVSQVAMPMMCAVSKDAEPGSANAFRNLLDFAQSLIVALVFPFAVLLMFTATWIMSLYGGAFARGADIVIAVSCAAMLAATGSATGSAIMSQGRVWLGLAINLSWAAVTLTISWFTVPIAGAKALALASAAGYLLTSVWAFAVLAPQLPSGMLRRLYASSAFALLSTVVCFLSPDSIRTLIALPALFVTTCTCAFVFTSPRVRSEIRTTLSLVMSTQFAIHGPRSSRDC
jgi:O-antigen/teichoic acid export membrane protein